MSGEVDGHREGRQEKTKEFHTGIREGRECEDIKAMGCSSEEAFPCACSRNKLLCGTRFSVLC